MRVHKSRPTSSVPMGCVTLGGANWEATFNLSGSAGVTNCGTAAQTMKNSTMAPPKTSETCTRRSRAVGCAERGSATVAAIVCDVVAMWSDLANADPRVQQRIQNVRHQVDQDEERGEHQSQRHDRRVVQPLERFIRVQADAWPLKDGLDQDDPGQQVPQLNPQHADHRVE